MIISEEMCKEIEKRLRSVPIMWDGKNAILEMKNAGNRHWKQMEWIGFFFNIFAKNIYKGYLDSKFQDMEMRLLI